MNSSRQAEPQPALGDQTAGLELIEISKHYGDLTALDRLTFDVRPGEMHGFVGPNGAGKTTAMRITLGVLASDSGMVRWRGEPITPEQRRRIGYMPEERGLYPKMRVADQLTYLAELHRIPAPQAKERTFHWLERLGIDDRAEDAVETLSLGNQQRVQLAASLVFDPELLVLDEPFSGLDPIGVDVLSQVLLEVCREQNVPVVFSSHQLELVEKLCDRVTIIKDGRLVASGDVDELRRTHGGNTWRLELADGAASEFTFTGAESLAPGIFRLDPDTDPQQLLDHGRRHGEVLNFGREQARLADLFREVVVSGNGHGEAT